MKKRFFAFSVFLLIVLSCFSFLYMFPVLGSESGKKDTPPMEFKSWQVGRSDKGTDTTDTEEKSFITSTQTLCRFIVSIGYQAGIVAKNTSPIDPNTVKWSVVDASHKMKLDTESVQKNWSGSSPSDMASDTSFNVVGSLTVPKVVGTRTVTYKKNGKTKTKQVPDYIGSTSCSHSADKDRLKRTPVHRDGKKMKFTIKFTAQTENGQNVEYSLKFEQDDKDQIRQEYVDYNKPIPSRNDGKWSAQDTYDFGHYDTMMNDGLGGSFKKWVDEINKQRQKINEDNTKKDPTATPLEDLTIDDFVVTSGYRNPHHNFDHTPSTALLSPHMYGYALDVSGRDIDGVPGNDQQKMMTAANAAGARYQSKYSSGHVHADWAPSNWASRSSKAGDPPVFKLPKAGNSSSSSSSSLNVYPTNGVSTVAAGNVHTSTLSAVESLYEVNWYVASSGETGRGSFVEYDSGGSGVTTASLDYTFLSSGDYVITAVAYKYSDMSKLGEVSYTVSVTVPSLSYSLVSSDGVYTATAGFGHEANFTTSRPYSYVYWYVTPPDGTESGVNTEYGDGSKTTSQLGYSFPSGVSGDYLFKAYVYDGDNTTVYEASYTVSVSLPSVSAPVWRDIPDPDNLTVGDYFYLVFSNYVSGSPTITWDSGTQPAGTTFSDGMLMGEVSQVESCYFRVKATNSAGSAYSNWISMTISAPVVTATRPDAPTGLSASAGATAGTVDFSWTAPADNGSPITDYKVAYGSYNNGWGGWTPYTSIGSTSTSYTVTGLESGRTYRLRVRAVNSLGDGRFSRYAQITVP